MPPASFPSRLVVALLLVLVGAGARPGAAADDGDPGLFARQAPGYDATTIERVGDLAVATYRDLPHIVERVAERGRRAGPANSAMLLLLMACIVLTLAARRRFARRVETAVAAISAGIDPRGRAALAAAAQVAAAAGPPLLLWLVHELLRRLTGFDGPGYVIVGIMLLAWSYYALVVTTVRELVMRPLIVMPREHGRYLYGITRWLALYGLLLYALLDVAVVVGVPADAIALLQSLLDLSLIVMATLVLVHKRAVLSLLPPLPNRLYTAFVRGLSATYPVVLALTLATVLLGWAGYVSLAHAVWLRSWAVVGVFLATVFALHAVRKVLRRAIVGSDAPSRESLRFYGSAARLFDFIAVLVFADSVVTLTGLGPLLHSLLAAPIYALGDRTLSPLMAVEALVVVVAFVFLARLLRDYLNYHVYPALGVDAGVANAIDVFINYTLIIVGVLFALELAGVGVGVLTVFAGALGIGLGFGLQSIANNLTSGLTLVFGRALRRGDWVAVGGTVGVIEEIGMRATTLRTRDAVDYVVPNAELVGGTIVNWTGSSPLVREHVPIAVAHGADPAHVRAVLLRVAAATAGVEAAPEPVVWLTGFGDDTLNFELLIWVNVKAVAAAQLRSDLYFAAFQAFKEAGIEIPRQREVRLGTISPESAQALSAAARHAEPEPAVADSYPRALRRPA